MSQRIVTTDFGASRRSLRISMQDQALPRRLLPASAVANVKRAIREALQRFRVDSAEIDVILVNDADIAELNEKFLGHPGPTDVMTFDSRDGAGGAEAASAPCGEIVISMDTAKREALERGHGVDAEVALYAVHGVLHLLGLEDSTAAKARRMHEWEDRILSACGFGTVFRSPQVLAASAKSKLNAKAPKKASTSASRRCVAKKRAVLDGDDPQTVSRSSQNGVGKRAAVSDRTEMHGASELRRERKRGSA